MIKTYTKWLAGLLVFLLIFSMALPVFAAEAPEIRVPVRIETSGRVPAGVEYAIVLEADNPNYPMPEGSEDGVFVFRTKETGQHFLPPIQFTKVGVYTYTIKQNPGSNPACTYDDRVYELVVYVTHGDDDDLQITVLLYLAGSEEKLDEAVFKNRCPDPGTEPPVTEPPVTEPPSTEPPATEPPATEPPTTEPPATEKPVTEKPGTEKTVTEKPKTEKPKKDSNPITGDAGILMPLALSAAGIVGVILLEKNRKRK